MQRVNRLLASARLTIDAIQAETLAIASDAIERIVQMEALAERRRNAIWREIERHRAQFASSLRRTTTDIESAALHSVSRANNKPKLQGERQ